MLIQQLKEENERLKKMGGGMGGGGEGMTEAEKEEMKKQMEAEMEQKLQENMRAMAEMSKGWEEKLKEAQEKAAAEGDGTSGASESKRKQTVAHILNVHEDPVMSKAICYFFPPDKTTVFGNRNTAGSEDILLGGLSVRPDHCRVSNEGGKLTLTVREECKVLVNGAEVSGAVDLSHCDRLSIGTNYFFVVVNPPQIETPPEGGWPEVDWDYLNREIAKAQGLSVDVNWSAMTEEEKRRALLNDELVQVMPRVTEANALSNEMKRGISFETKITPVMTKNQGMISQVMVKVKKLDTGMEWLWDKIKFINRVYIMREQYEKHQEGSLDLSSLEPNEDPFWDPNEFMSMGYSTVFLKPLAYCMNIEDDYAIYHETQQDGVVRVKIAPCRQDGTLISEEDEGEGPYDDVEEPKDLIGKRYDILVQVRLFDPLFGRRRRAPLLLPTPQPSIPLLGHWLGKGRTQHSFPRYTAAQQSSPR